MPRLSRDISGISSRRPAAQHDGRNAGACETDAHLGRACLLSVSLSLPLRQSWPKGPRQRLTKTHLDSTGRLRWPVRTVTGTGGQGRSDKDCYLAREVKVLFFADTGSIQHSITYHTPRGICTKQRVSDLVGRLARPSFGLQRSDFGFQTVCLKGQILIFKAGVRTAGRPVAVRRASRGLEPAGSRHEAKQA